jgi:hypothetical protein
VSLPTDVEISRALNALSMTLRDQRPEHFDGTRAEQIVLGAVAHEPKLRVLATGADSGEVQIRDDGRVVATVCMQDGQWVVERRMRAGESSWALPQPAHDEQQAGEKEGAA